MKMAFMEIKNTSGEMKIVFLEMKHTSVETRIGGFRLDFALKGNKNITSLTGCAESFGPNDVSDVQIHTFQSRSQLTSI